MGPPLEGTEETVGGIPVRRHGVLPAAEVSRLLLGSLAGFVAYPAYFLPKSTIFAAYCAHGVLPVQAWRRRSLDGRDRPPVGGLRRSPGDRLGGPRLVRRALARAAGGAVPGPPRGGP